MRNYTAQNTRWLVSLLAIVTVMTLGITAGCSQVIIDKNAVVAPDPPPPPRPEARSIKPGVRFAWKPGRWRYVQEKKRYAWAPGKWIRIRQPYHHHWVPGKWHQTSDGYVWIEGHWR